MYVPEQYRPRDASWTLELIRSNPLALLVTNGPQHPWATHVPVLFAEEPDGPEGPDGLDATGDDLVGRRLLGHLNLMNPHWEALAGAGHALLVFQGPGSYVSPTVYETAPAAPTWDFTSVHVHGALRLIDDPDDLRKIVRATVRAYEREVGTDWDMSESLEYFERLLPGVRGFEIKIESVDSMFKLSQEQLPETVTKVIDSFRRSDGGRRQELATMIERAASDKPGDLASYRHPRVPREDEPCSAPC
ncbi:FMN-binding negative transcriptional regulator [Streptomyces sp. NPDC057718]|uniref:FMN-binding negative transcriptional regulator n=1 Tax=Streptomyces sp. NPDC057718 TaxID=3346225 RepID=UPI0036C56900